MARERSGSFGGKLSDIAISTSENILNTGSPRLSGVGSPRATVIVPVPPSPRKTERGFFLLRKKSTEVMDNNNGSPWASASLPELVKGKNESNPTLDDLRKTLFTKSCPDKANYLGSPRRSSFVTSSPPRVPPLKLAQSASLNKVDSSSSAIPPPFLIKNESTDSLYSSCDENGNMSDDEHHKEAINMIFKKFSSSEIEDEEHIAGEAIDLLTVKGNKAFDMRFKNIVRSRTNSYVRDDELQSTEGDDNGIRSVLAVHEVLTSDIKTIQSLLDDKMVLLRSLFDVPEYGEYNNVALWVSTIFLAHDKTMYLLKWAIEEEVDAAVKHAEADSALFRADSMSCALCSNFLRLLGKLYLQKVIGPIIQKKYLTKKCYEVEPHRPGGSKANTGRLWKLASSLLKAVFKSVSTCPRIIRELLHHMRATMARSYSDEIALKTVSSFFFLRFVCPAILYPKTYGILETIQEPTPQATRAFVLCAKILQNIANGVDASDSLDMNKRINKKATPMHKFMDKICQKPEGNTATITSDCFPTQQQYKSSVHDLQAYINEKIAAIPKARPDIVVDGDPSMRLIKLRRALQSYSHTWRSQAKLVIPPPIVGSPSCPPSSLSSKCFSTSVRSTSHSQSSTSLSIDMLSTSAGSEESSSLSVLSSRDM